MKRSKRRKINYSHVDGIFLGLKRYDERIVREQSARGAGTSKTIFDVKLRDWKGQNHTRITRGPLKRHAASILNNLLYSYMPTALDNETFETVHVFGSRSVRSTLAKSKFAHCSIET
jgi:hypothetical protein